MKVAIMCSGGDSSGMNPAIKRFIEYSFELGFKPYLIYDGLEGMIDGNIKKADYSDAAGIIFRGGTIIGSSRSKRFYEYEYRKKAYENLKNKGIEALMVLGGNGSFKALDVFSKEFPVLYSGIPATIDNDIALNEYTLGTDTALNVIRHACDEIRDTSSSFRRGSIIETMGRECGYLALVSALSSGAEICLVPEIEFNLSSIKKRLIKEFKEGRRYLIAIVAEGVGITHYLKEWLEREIGIESRATVLGHVQRGGSPTVFDRLMAYEFVTIGLENLSKGISGVVVYNNGNFGLKDIDEINAAKYQIKPMLLKFGERLAN
ncbi:MAG: 6-phosphofructokinase [Epsilonproteobacteria bacterium]|nr:6-phosphofructokinase [Campylobacterota bacterium]